MALQERIIGFGSEDWDSAIPLLTDSKQDINLSPKPDDRILTVDEVSQLPPGTFISRLVTISTYHEQVRRQRVRKDIKNICEEAQFHSKDFMSDIVAYWIKCVQTYALTMKAIVLNVYTGLDETHNTNLNCLAEFTKRIAEYKSKVSTDDQHFVNSAVLDEFVIFMRAALDQFQSITKIPRYRLSDVRQHIEDKNKSSAGFCCREFTTTFKIYVWWMLTDMVFIVK